jgi:hypothetical protein
MAEERRALPSQTCNHHGVETETVNVVNVENVIVVYATIRDKEL